ncbi:hypothetical protein ABLA30_13810 [Xenorhabdus nematophila]|uniref:hypothetical protein n=1 Tax=Xenorhabdus nematophila TaxID=628 RepID=UPI0032B80771
MRDLAIIEMEAGNYEIGIKLLTQQALLDDKKSILYLAKIYFYGIWVTRNVEKAEYFLRKLVPDEISASILLADLLVKECDEKAFQEGVRIYEKLVAFGNLEAMTKLVIILKESKNKDNLIRAKELLTDIFDSPECSEELRELMTKKIKVVKKLYD